MLTLKSKPPILITKVFPLISEKKLHMFSKVLHHSVQFSHSVMSDSLRPHGLQHARPPCPSPTLGVHPNSCPLSQWCYPTILSSAIPFFSCPQSFPASGSFQMSHLFTSDGQLIYNIYNMGCCNLMSHIRTKSCHKHHYQDKYFNLDLWILDFMLGYQAIH